MMGSKARKVGGRQVGKDLYVVLNTRSFLGMMRTQGKTAGREGRRRQSS